jgi:hypothetical protein
MNEAEKNINDLIEVKTALLYLKRIDTEKSKVIDSADMNFINIKLNDICEKLSNTIKGVS